MNVACGLGRSCSAACFAHSASFCPSGNCSDCQNVESNVDNGVITDINKDTHRRNNPVTRKRFWFLNWLLGISKIPKETEKPEITEIPEEQENEPSKCLSWASSNACNRCVKDGCPVKQSPGCCYHPTCMKNRPSRCKWMQGYLADTCPKPGDIPLGQWFCFEGKKTLDDTFGQIKTHSGT